MTDKVDLVVDAVGLYCPEPIVLLTEEIESLQHNQILELVADDPSSEEDVKRWSKRTGHPVLEITKDDDEIHFLIRKR